jgi:hypothetical protein
MEALGSPRKPQDSAAGGLETIDRLLSRLHRVLKLHQFQQTER